ncbi:phytanoyl-CoA dioxygenase family protein [Fodinibius sediminis]|uniref:Ectoine hydroxylase-related dioxygenase, phytanoyl-CoA dioxygenase (PhyH) family n=1 Tax=Fodinibius sediminis TaxID=1214077 RepID=A0A521CA77_9BACT|nr:phytanoyl-CoA dioxygenase family protein [Fodinibius sediminis]SMO56308.1 Ectoine hydroxylase-related dioxygenase, phytanoyl-CoA dioxygenase (PhyH) family [Fodinibius sediminis]
MPKKNILGKEQLAFFNDNGYLAIDQLTSREDVAFIREIFDTLFSSEAGRKEGDQFDLAGPGEAEEASLPQIMNPAKYAPELNNSELLKNASAALSQLFGEPVEATFFHAINKPPRHGAETPWHQDAAYWDPVKLHNKISVWVPLQEVFVDNGCMQFIPRSHLMDILPHQSINNDPRVQGLELVPEECEKIKGKAVPCPLPPGGATFHGGYTLHYAGPNKTDRPRRAIILEAELPPSIRDKPMRFPWLERRDAARKQKKP